MPDTCASCGAKLPFLRRVSRQTLCSDCEAKNRQSIASLTSTIRNALADEIR
jgi:predicted amidophosphoribosyltransferase